MAGSGPHLLSDARTLATRLHDQDKVIDSLLAQTQTLNEKMCCMKEFQEDLYELNEVSHQRPRSALVHSLQQENRQIRQLQEENRRLKLALEEHQTALDLIMARYRRQVLRMMKLNQMHQVAEQAVDAVRVNRDSDIMNKLLEFGHLFASCLQLGEESSRKDQEELARLQAENRTLRQLLKIAAPNDPQAISSYAQLLRSQQQQRRSDEACILPSADQTGKNDEQGSDATTPIADTEPSTSTVVETATLTKDLDKSSVSKPVDGAALSSRSKSVEPSSSDGTGTKSSNETPTIGKQMQHSLSDGLLPTRTQQTQSKANGNNNSNAVPNANSSQSDVETSSSGVGVGQAAHSAKATKSVVSKRGPAVGNGLPSSASTPSRLSSAKTPLEKKKSDGAAGQSSKSDGRTSRNLAMNGVTGQGRSNGAQKAVKGS